MSGLIEMGLDTMQTDKQLINDKEAAAMLGCARSTYWRWVSDGIMPQPIKIGGLSRWYQTEIEGAIAAAAEKSRAPQPTHRVRQPVRAA